jgi:NADPH:quinone reductase-like Zn-dependent oxidoreductase
MRSWVLTGEPGSPLRLEDRPEPELGPGQVRVRMHAASLNHRDCPRSPCSRPARWPRSRET